MQPLHDQFVAVVAIACGCLLIWGAARNSAALLSLSKPRLLSAAVGPRVARLLLGAIGLIVIAMGLLIARGWRMQW